jgi:hypothetical protein
MDIYISNCSNSDFCGFGKNQKKISRFQTNKFDKKETILGYVAEKIDDKRKDEILPNKDDDVWFYFPTPLSKKELLKILDKLDFEEYRHKIPSDYSKPISIPKPIQESSISISKPIQELMEPKPSKKTRNTKSKSKKKKPTKKKTKKKAKISN